MSCIASGIYSRSVLGNAVGGALASQMLEMVPLLSGVALELIAAIDAAPGAVEQMGFPLCETGRRMLRRLRKFNQDFAIPAEKEVLTHYHVSEGVWPSRGNRWRRHRMIDELIAEARKLGLWNLWVSPVLARQLTTEFPAWPWDRLLPHGQALSAVSYAYIAMESGRCSLTPVLINCAAPDSGNMEVIGMFGTRQQKERWLLPLLEGETKSCFGMTEPAISSSDPTALSATAVPTTGGGWRLNGDKWWTTVSC
jgi:alkylation response protein AidB-like acyl-CoA dehydrogenase